MMIVIDAMLGPTAEFLNAFSVVQRVVGQASTSGASLVAQKSGAVGEFVFVVVPNTIIGGGPTVVAWLRTKR